MVDPVDGPVTTKILAPSNGSTCCCLDLIVMPIILVPSIKKILLLGFIDLHSCLTNLPIQYSKHLPKMLIHVGCSCEKYPSFFYVKFHKNFCLVNRHMPLTKSSFLDTQDYYNLISIWRERRQDLIRQDYKIFFQYHHTPTHSVSIKPLYH